jgi:hypothetical protein
MTSSLISLLSIITGIIGANIFGKVLEKYSLGLVGNTIAGVFGSIFLIKSIGRLGFDANTIMESAELNMIMLTLNLSIALSGGVIAVYIASRVINRINS